MNIAFVPLYIKYLGMESYGLIGFYAMFQSALLLLDAGMTPTLSREMARYSAGKHSNETIRDLLRTLEILCLIFSIAYCMIVWLSSDWVATNWLQARDLSSEVVAQAFLLIGLVAALRFIEGLYRGAILGLQKQVIFNLANGLMNTLRCGGAVLILAFIAPTIKAYFVWQAVISLATVLVFIAIVYKSLPKPLRRAGFSVPELKKVWRFAAGVMMTSALGIIISQIDKVFLSRFLSLENFGNYSLAITVSNVLIIIIGPITQAHYPRISELIGKGDEVSLKKSFHIGSQLATVFASCGAFSLFFFGEKIIELWTGNPELAKNIFPVLKILSIGTFLNSLWHMPYVLQLSYGWSSFAAKVNFAGAIFLVPAMFFAIPVYGPAGAAMSWLIMNLGYILIGSYFMFKNILAGERNHWLLFDILLPALGAFLTMNLFFNYMPVSSGRIFEISFILASSISAFCISIFISKELRNYSVTLFRLKTSG